MRTFNIRAYIDHLHALLGKASIDHLYVFVDDFSELPAEAMKVVVDSIIGPLNNWSDELIKFKIAAYPGRIYYGAVDKTKIDEINLDLYALYGTADHATMEEKAMEFTRRLIERRLRHYGRTDALPYLGSEYRRNSEEVWRQLFYATMANPRNLGYILYFMYESELLYGRSISLRSIREAARRYYEEKVEADFNMKRFLHETFEERSSIFSLKELLDHIVERARELRTSRSSSVMRELEGRPPTSHFHVVTELDPLLATLELNFFLTKYFVMKDRDARQVTVFALNYGLCQKETIESDDPGHGESTGCTTSSAFSTTRQSSSTTSRSTKRLPATSATRRSTRKCFRPWLCTTCSARPAEKGDAQSRICRESMRRRFAPLMRRRSYLLSTSGSSTRWARSAGRSSLLTWPASWTCRTRWWASEQRCSPTVGSFCGR